MIVGCIGQARKYGSRTMSEFWFEHLESTLTDKGVVAYMWDNKEDRFRWAGDLLSVFGLERKDCPSSNAQFQTMINPQDAAGRLTALHDFLGLDKTGGESFSFSTSYRVRCADGSSVHIEESATMHTENGSGRSMLCGVLKLQSMPISTAAGRTDNIVPVFPDSGFTNYGRRVFQRTVEEWFDVHGAGDRSHGYVLAVGIDRTSLFNEVMGPRYADEIIENTGTRLQQIAADSGSVMRIDGDVYGVFFRQAPHNEMAAVARFILNSFYNSPLQTSMGPMGVGISIGGVTLDKAKNPESAVTMAEMAMHLAKDKGRSCFVSYEEASRQAEGNHRLLKSADTFLKAMKDNRLRLAFQPVMGSRDNSVSFHECLIRIMDKGGNLIAASAFMPAIEELGLSRLVDQYALRMAVQELSMFHDLVLSVNVSNLSLTDHDWLRDLVATLRDQPSVAKRLIVEITESAVIKDADKTRHIVRTLKDLGCRVALDDFGAGYTAFSQLKDLKVDLVKIDQSFIRNIDEEHNHLFVRTLKSLADGVNVETVGEGAETLAEARMLVSDGIDHIQGFVFGLPSIDRLWLPENHSHRKASVGSSTEQTGLWQEDVASWGGG